MAKNKDINIRIRGKDQASGVFARINQSVKGLGKSLISIPSLIGGLSVGAAAGFGVKLAANLEQAEVAFGTLLGSAEKAKVLLDDLSNFAASTPFQFEGLTDAARKLVAFGVAQEDVLPTMRTIGDIAAGVNQPIGELAEIYGKARVQGRLFAEDINQLTGRGIPIIQELAKQFGVADSEVRGLVESGQVGFKNIDRAFRDMTGSGGRFFGMMSAQSRTLAGLWSTLKDNAQILLRDVAGIALKTLDASGGMERLIESTQRFSVTAIAAAGSSALWATQNTGLIKDIGIASAATLAWIPILSTLSAAMKGVTLSYIAANAATVSLRLASIALSATLVGALLAGLSVVTTAFIRAKLEGVSFGEAILKIASDLGVLDLAALRMKSANEQLAEATAKVVAARNELSGAKNDQDRLTANEKLASSLKAQISARERLNQIEIQQLKQQAVDGEYQGNRTGDYSAMLAAEAALRARQNPDSVTQSLRKELELAEAASGRLTANLRGLPNAATNAGDAIRKSVLGALGKVADGVTDLARKLTDFVSFDDSFAEFTLEPMAAELRRIGRQSEELIKNARIQAAEGMLSAEQLEKRIAAIRGAADKRRAEARSGGGSADSLPSLISGRLLTGMTAAFRSGQQRANPNKGVEDRIETGNRLTKEMIRTMQDMRDVLRSGRNPLIRVGSI